MPFLFFLIIDEAKDIAEAIKRSEMDLDAPPGSTPNTAIDLSKDEIEMNKAIEQSLEDGIQL